MTITNIQLHNQATAYLKDRGFVQTLNKTWVRQGSKTSPYIISLHWEKITDTTETIDYCEEYSCPSQPQEYTLCLEEGLDSFKRFVRSIVGLNEVYGSEVLGKVA